MANSIHSGPLNRIVSVIRDAGAGGTPALPAAASYRGEELAAALLARVFQRLPGTIAVRIWRGAAFRCGAGAGASGAAQPVAAEPRFVVCFRDPWAVCDLVLGRDPLRLAEAYFRGDVDIEGDLYAALCLKDHFSSLKVPLRERLSSISMAVKLRDLNQHAPRCLRDGVPSHGRPVRSHSRDESRSSAEFHYDLSNEFYRLWLGRGMVYSCAYFERPDEDLDDAQQAKLEHICRKLMLRPGEKFLDIGCGWGALVMHAAQRHGVYAHGITLSQKQLGVARQRIADAGLKDRVTVELKDYRDLQGHAAYDKVASVGMWEHVGRRSLPLYFSTVHRLLKPTGLFLGHGVTHPEAQRWRKSISTRFINRYVFPDGQLDSVSNIQGFMENAGFEITDAEAVRSHYALTLRAWVQRLERRHGRALEYVSEAAYRVRRLYMAACALEFESGRIGVYELLASKRGPYHARLPLTRGHLYGDPAASK